MIETHVLSAAVVVVGEELVSGETVDSNGAWLSRQLASLGAAVRRRWVVGDDPAMIQDAVARALEAAQVIVVTGGLGPTADDITREAVAELLDLELRLDTELLEGLEDRFRSRGYDVLPPSNVGQAMVPEGAEVMPNALGSAPGIAITHEDRLVALLPGVPREMRGMFGSELAGRIRARYGPRLAPLWQRTLHTTGIPESVLGERVDALRSDLPEGIDLAFLPDLRGVAVRISARGGETDAVGLLDAAERALQALLARYRVPVTSGEIAEAVAEALTNAGLTLAVAESCTGGLVAKRLTDRAGSSVYFRGGVVAYDDQIKVQLLGVDQAVLDDAGAVSEVIAASMALGVAERMGTDAGIGVTGIAGPEGGSREKPVGTVWYAACVRGKVQTGKRIFTGDREAIRERAGQAVLDLLFHMLDDLARAERTDD